MRNLLFVLLLIPTVVFAQKNVLTISGRVLDGETHLPLEYVNALLFSLPDSAYLRSTITEGDGNFTISSDITPGDYFLRVSFIGYETVDKNISIKESTGSINLGRISLNEDAILLEEAVVVAEAIPVIVKEDTTIFSASAFRVTDGAMLEELIKKLPGAEINDEGKITVNGKEIKKIMVDGKEFFSDDPKIAMKNLPANMVEKVKAYDRKSDNARLTGIEDDEDETVLDLSVKKGMKKGWFGNVLAGAGNKERYEAGGMINRFQDQSNFSVIASMNNTNNQGFSEFGDTGFGVKGNAGSGITASKIIGTTFAQEYNKVQLGGSIQYGHSDNNAERKRATETFLEKGSSFGADTSSSRRKRDDLAVNFKLEWKPDTMTTITFRPNMSYGHTLSGSNSRSQVSNNLHRPVNYKLSGSSVEGNNVSANGLLQYFRKLNKAGRNFSLSARMDYTYSESDNDAYSTTHFYLYPDDEEVIDSLLLMDQYTDKNSNGYTYRLQASYTEPVFAKHYLQFKYTFQQRNSMASAYVYDNNANTGTYVDSLSNKVENQYNTHQMEINLQGQHAKLNYNVGFALEPQSSESETTIGPNSGKNMKQQVVNFSPNLRLRYRFSKQEMFMVRYRGQSSAPNVEYLQEIIDISDPLNLQYGNPDLKPSYRNLVTMRYSNFVSETQQTYSLNGNFSNTLNAIASQLIYNAETGGKESRMLNVNGNWNANAFFTFNTPFRNRKFSLSTTTNAAYSDEVSFTSEETDYSSEDAFKNVTHTLGLKEKLTGNYRSDLFDVSLNASANYTLTKNNLKTQNNRETFNYELGGNTNINLPWNVYLSTDVNYRIYTGYSDGFNNNTVIWNAQVSKNFLKNNAATVRFKIYDILRQQNNLTRTITETMLSDTEYNTLGSYFMVHFVYRINTLGKQASRSQEQDKWQGSPEGERRPDRGDRQGYGGGQGQGQRERP